MTKKNGTLEIKLGEFCEGLPWKLVENEECDNDIEPCKHCVDVRQSAPRFRHADGAVTNAKHKTYTVPLSVHALNEAGYNGTIVCYHCIVEAAALLDGGNR